ncbi:MAG: FlgD immunoglobulin-like domain containing protein, partial [Candidatus Margulisiibacteriota bacterium]
MIIRYKIIICLLIAIFGYSAYASNIEGTKTYKDYIFILVHGLNSNKGIFTGEKGFGDLKGFLEKPTDQGGLGLKGHVFAYTFNDPSGDYMSKARELGDRKYNNVPEMDGLCWLEKAKKDFVNSNPAGTPVPDKYILVTHSAGNLAARAYIYSNNFSFRPLWGDAFGHKAEEGFYQNDVDKVVFVAAPFTGTGATYLYWQAWWDIAPYFGTKTDKWLCADWDAKWQSLQNGVGKVLETFDIYEIYNMLKGSPSNPFSPYLSAASFGGASALGLAFVKNIYSTGPGESKISVPWSPGVVQLFPSNAAALSSLTYLSTGQPNIATLAPVVGLLNSSIDGPRFVGALNNAKLSDPAEEPAYSIFYGRGIPTYDPVTTATFAGLKEIYQRRNADSLSEFFQKPPKTEAGSGDMIGSFFDLDYQKATLLQPGFWALPTIQAKFLSLAMARTMDKLDIAEYFFGGGYFTQDGDFFVPVGSASGDEVGHLKNAQRRSYTFKADHFENYLNDQFIKEVAVTEAAIATAAYFASLSGVPYQTAWESFWWMRIPAALSLIDKVYYDLDGLKKSLEAHGRILDQQDLVKTAILDTFAIATITDLQTVATGEVGGSPEATTLSFSVGPAVPSGFESIKVKSVAENRATSGAVNLPVPMTLKALSATGEGERKYVTSIMVTKPPERIAGKLNYLVPKLMRSFEYSFNFAAWKPIENVNPETGEFVLENLPFAEGQNVLAIRSENAVGVKAHQLMTFTLNTVPLLSTGYDPAPQFYINDNKHDIYVEFNMTKYSKISDLSFDSMTLDGETVVPETEIVPDDYHLKLKVRYKIPSDKPLKDGEHRVVVRVNSEVGSAQAIWPFYVDTKPPFISIEAIAPFSPRAPATIRYNASDEVSPNLLAARCDLYDSNDNFITNIATSDTVAKGDNFFTWDPNLVPPPADGEYKVKIKIFDLPKNSAIAEQPVVIDSTPPVVAGVNVEPNPLTSKTTELGLTTRVNEKSTVIIRLNNTTNNSTTAYLTQAIKAPDGGSFIASYIWKYNDMLSKGPEDGIYNVEVIARDEAGNESAPRTLEAVRIDRTPPKIYGQITSPYVLSNIGSNAYKTTLSYNLSEAKSAKVKIYNSNTGALVNTIPVAPAVNGANEINWDGSSASLPKGAYRFQIIAEDDVGNIGTAYASCVKDGIAPEISYPAEDNTVVTGTISIRGTAIDPDWTNDKPFKDYRVYYKKSGEDWKTDFVEVPQVNRDPKDPKNISIRPLQNNSTLAYLYTNNLANGDYTIKVEVNEENGETLAATRLIRVNNDPMTASSIQVPYVKLKPVPATIEFKPDDSIKLPLGFINSVKPANVYLEVIKTGTLETPVYFKYFPNILGAPFIGKPDYKPGTDLGYFIWSDDDGYHLRWSADGSNHKFTGNIIITGGAGYSDVKTIGGGIKVQSPLINWDSSISGGEGGLDFKAASGQLMITAKTDEDPASPSITADNVYLGVSRYSQQYLPIIIDVAGQRLVDISSMGKAAASSNLERSTQTIDWNGKLDTSAYPDSGSYVVRVRAEGVDGVGVATDESMVEIKTPFEISNLRADPVDRKFSTLGGIDRVSVFYNVSKDSIVTANVFDDSDKYVATIANGKEVLGTTNLNNQLSVVWRGNFPDPDSGTVVTGGTYK